MHITIPVLCVHSDTNYKNITIPGTSLQLYDKTRDAYTFKSSQKLIAHPPCQQWSKLKGLALKDKKEKNLALFCYEYVNKNGGILEHPLGSSLFNYVNADKSKIFLVHQHVFGFPAQKPTLLYCNNIDILPIPSHMPGIIKNIKNVNQLTQHQRSKMTVSFCNYLIQSLLNSK